MPLLPLSSSPSSPSSLSSCPSSSSPPLSSPPPSSPPPSSLPLSAKAERTPKGDAARGREASATNSKCRRLRRSVIHSSAGEGGRRGPFVRRRGWRLLPPQARPNEDGTCLSGARS
ncbi:MAG: hypothetical protein DI589_04885 [Shinella sp.]|nr:MAG: hypothetical protein DI589_04885 [Shinella sp.]